MRKFFQSHGAEGTVDPLRLAAAAGAVVLLCWLAPPATAAGAGDGAGSAKVVKRPVTFNVRNINRSALPCSSDGAAYEVEGHLIGPGSEVGPGASGERGSVTLYLHGFSSGEAFWNFRAVPRFDYAGAMARAGHASVVIDRLGYGSSGHPEGNQSCLGAQADVAHQVIGELRSGDYLLRDGEPLRFGKVALAGHSAGALIANLEAFSFNDIDGLVAMSFTPQVTPGAFEQFYASRVVCGTGGEQQAAGGPGGYAYLAQTDAEFQASAFHSAEPAVVNVATSLRSRDPCGDSASIVDALVLDLKSLPRVRTPVLLVCGREDAVTPEFACPYLKRRYVGSADVALSFVPKAGHALPLERKAPVFRRRVSAWLNAHGF
jgi:pimeloyl-ACP methyl ester carboxylesterase